MNETCNSCCTVSWIGENGEALENTHPRIIYCLLHAAAPDLLEKLEKTVAAGEKVVASWKAEEEDWLEAEKGYLAQIEALKGELSLWKEK